jgi:pyridinium-3,5-biscarboxylic acid mononucleotide sulfurtransferase
LRQVRVRDYLGRARVEVGQDELDRLFETPRQDRVMVALEALGFIQVTLDPAGYRQGGTNPTAGT